MESSRKIALRAYFVEVVRDLAHRGVFRWRNGQPIEHIVMEEGLRLLDELRVDLSSIGLEFTMAVVGAGTKLAGNMAEQAIQRVFNDLFKRRG